jgi:hypothetical protein
MFALAACSAPTKIVNSNAESVSISFDGDPSKLQEVSKMATAECMKNGRPAVLRDIAQVEDVRVANYDCRRPQQ